VAVVDLGGGLAVVGPEDAPGVLDEPSLLGDGRGEEEGVQRVVPPKALLSRPAVLAASIVQWPGYARGELCDVGFFHATEVVPVDLGDAELAEADLAPETQGRLVHSGREARGRTMLVIAHQLETIRAADQILFLDAGRIVEVGPHDQLLATGGRYAHFWSQRAEAAGWTIAND
jgi:hypothetical protein